MQGNAIPPYIMEANNNDKTWFSVDAVSGAYSAPPDPLTRLRGGLLLRGEEGNEGVPPNINSPPQHWSRYSSLMLKDLKSL